MSSGVQHSAAGFSLRGMPPLQSPYSLLAFSMDAGNRTFMDHVATPPNLQRASHRAVANRGAPGIDGMTVAQLVAAWPCLHNRLSKQLLEGTYAPAAICRHAVPKPGSKVTEWSYNMGRCVSRRRRRRAGGSAPPWTRPGKNSADIRMREKHHSVTCDRLISEFYWKGRPTRLSLCVAWHFSRLS
jgi:hypothetical protein